MYHPDVDLTILHQLDDLDLDHVCYINKSLHHLSTTSNFWFVKCNPFQLPTLNLNPQEWKALYYKIKYNEWDHLVQFAEKTNNIHFLNWIIKQPAYIHKIDKRYNQLNKLFDIVKLKQREQQTNFYKFIYTHRYYHFNQNNNVTFMINYKMGMEFTYFIKYGILVDLCKLYLKFYQ